MTNLTTAKEAWWGNVALTNLPAFPASSTALTNVYRAFYNCTNVSGSAPELWNTTNYPNLSSSTSAYYQCFYNCSNLSNYADIPANWK